MSAYSVNKDHQGQWRWLFVANNGKTIAVSSESYHNREDCLHGIRLVKTEGSTAGVVDTSSTPAQIIPGV
jgi:uncharacterized protein YegP (UPF0339 family)